MVNEATPELQSSEIKIEKKKAQDTVDVDDLEKLVDEHLHTGNGGKKKKKVGKKRSSANKSKTKQKTPAKDLVGVQRDRCLSPDGLIYSFLPPLFSRNSRRKQQ